jgi:hypothetical protein
VELGSLVAFAGRLLGEFLEVASSLWHGASEESDLDATSGLTSNLNVEEDLNGRKTIREFQIKKSEDVSFGFLSLLLLILNRRLEEVVFVKQNFSSFYATTGFVLKKTSGIQIRPKPVSQRDAEFINQPIEFN